MVAISVQSIAEPAMGHRVPEPVPSIVARCVSRHNRLLTSVPGHRTVFYHDRLRTVLNDAFNPLEWFPDG
jgi:hypothetical protein